MESPNGEREDIWPGGEWTREEFDRWVEYKRAKVHAFVDRGYSVEWYPDESRWMTVYTPQHSQKQQPELRAAIMFFSEPSKYGINGGRISKLTIQFRYSDIVKKVLGQEHEDVTTLYNYDRGHDVDRLREGSEAHRLFHAVIEELN